MRPRPPARCGEASSSCGASVSRPSAFFGRSSATNRPPATLHDLTKTGGVTLSPSLASGTASETVFSIGLVAAVIAFMVYRQIRPRRLTIRNLVLLPLILLVIIVRSWPLLRLTPRTTMESVVGAGVSLTLGLLAARQLRVYRSPDSGRAMASGSWTYFLWWLGAFVAKAGLAVALGETATTMNTVEVLIPVFLLVLTRNAYLYWRASRLGLPLH